MKTRESISRNKRLIRKIKQEVFNQLDYDNEILTNSLIADYNKSHEIPLELWTYDMLNIRLEELIQTSYKLSVLFPEYYREEYWGYGGEYYDILDEIDLRFGIDYSDIYE